MTTPNYPGTPSSVGTPFGESNDGGTQEQAKEQAKQTAGTAKEETKHVAGVAKDEAQNVAAEAKTQARNLLEDARTQVDEQSRTQRDRAVGTLSTLADELQQMARGEGGAPGMAQDLVQQVADRARGLSSRIDGREPSELLDEVRDYARRKPGTFLLGSLLAGMLAGRVTRGAKQASSSDASDDSYAAGNAGSPTYYDNPRGTATGYPTSGVGYPATEPVYPATGVVGGAAGTGTYGSDALTGDPLDPVIGASGVSTGSEGTSADDPTRRGAL